MRLEKVLKRNHFCKIKCKKTRTNHIEIKAKINGVKGIFILDTGASNSCVGFEFIDYFKLNAKDSNTKAAGAGATGLKTQVANKNTLTIGTWKVKNFNLVLIDLSHVNNALIQHEADAVHGIIGADILEKGKAIIDYKKMHLFLKRLHYKF